MAVVPQESISGRSRRTGSDIDRTSLSQVEEEHLGLLDSLERELAFLSDRRSVAGREPLSVEQHVSSGHLNPGMTPWSQIMRDALAAVQNRRVNSHVLMDGDRAISAVAGCDQAQLPRLSASENVFSS
jgi:hypothetical protein